MGWTEPFVFLSGVLMGTGSTIFVKVIYGLEAVGTSGEIQKFEKPLFVTWVMFLAMMLALPVHWLQRALQKGHKSADLETPWRTYFLLVIPAAFDLLGTALSGIGLLFTTVSVYQLLRSSVIIVTALLKATVLKHKLEGYMWLGICLNTLAMGFVASTSFFPGAAQAPEVDGNGENRDPRVGILFILASCAVQGSQYVFEEKVMTVDNAPPLVVVGMEGVWGTLLMPLVVFPWAYILPGTDVGGCVENVWDAWVMMLDSSVIQWVLFGFTVTVMLYNIFCIYVTYLLNSVWHAILDNFRPVSVWTTDLLLFYVFTRQKFGEPWTAYSWLEMAGMILLFVGTAVYNGSLQIPGLHYPPVLPLHEGEGEDIDLDEDEDLDLDGGPRMATPKSTGMASPLLTRSPLLSKSIQRDRRLSHEYNPLNIHSPHNYGAASNRSHAPPNPSSRRTAQTSNINSQAKR